MWNFTFPARVVRYLVVFWFLSVVVECGGNDRYDIHRIIIKEGKRSAGHNHNHNHHHHHHKHAHHTHHKDENNRKNHTHRSKNRSKHFKRSTTTTTEEPQEDFLTQETQLSSKFSDEWTPVLGKNNQIFQNPQKYNFKSTRSTRRRTTSRPKAFFETIDMTTQFPQKRPKPIIEKSKTYYLKQNSESEETDFFAEPFNFKKTSIKDESDFSDEKKTKFSGFGFRPTTAGYKVYESVEEDEDDIPKTFRSKPILDTSFSQYLTLSDEENESSKSTFSNVKNNTTNANFKKYAKKFNRIRGSNKFKKS